MGARKKQSKQWQFVLYVADDTVKSDFAINNLRRICNAHIGDNYAIQVINLREKPELTRSHKVLAVPTVVRTYPMPERRVIGDLSRTELVVSGLDLPGEAAAKPA